MPNNKIQISEITYLKTWRNKKITHVNSTLLFKQKNNDIKMQSRHSIYFHGCPFSRDMTSRIRFPSPFSISLLARLVPKRRLCCFSHPSWHGGRSQTHSLHSHAIDESISRCSFRSPFLVLVKNLFHQTISLIKVGSPNNAILFANESPVLISAKQHNDSALCTPKSRPCHINSNEQ